MAETRTFSKVILLVHPFYSFGPNTFGELKSLRFEKVRHNAQFMLGLWGKEIKDAAKDPDAVVFVVTHSKLARVPEGKKAAGLLPHFFRFARKELGVRLFVVKGTINPEMLRAALKKRGFVPSPNITGRAFGEWVGSCVRRERENLEKALNIPFSRIEEIQHLSMMPFHLEETVSAGAYVDNLRKRAVKRTRLQRGKK